jgi:hypothetical protein
MYALNEFFLFKRKLARKSSPDKQEQVFDIFWKRLGLGHVPKMPWRVYFFICLDHRLLLNTVVSDE